MDCHGYWYRQLCSPEDGGGGVRMTLINPATFYPVPPTLQNLQRSNASVHNGIPEAASRQFVKELWSIALHVCTNVKCPFSQDSLHEMEMNTNVYKSWAIWQSSGILLISRIWGTSWQNFQPLLTIFIHKCCQRSSRMNPLLLSVLRCVHSMGLLINVLISNRWVYRCLWTHKCWTQRYKFQYQQDILQLTALRW